MSHCRVLRRAALFLAICTELLAAPLSPLFLRGYTVIPEPQKVSLTAADLAFGRDWRLETKGGVDPRDTAVTSLREDLEARHGIRLGASGSGPVVRLALSPGSVAPGNAAGSNKSALAEQAYRLEIAPAQITITANAPTGLFHGTRTLLQLPRLRDGSLWLPEVRIEDWPDLELRHIYWDDAHHLERLDELKRAIRQAAFYKINGFAIKLEGHFQYKSAPAIVEPQALTPAQFQELTDYGLRFHVQVVPYLDGPSHIAFILKHPEYAGLREYAESNYELCVTNPDSYKLLFGMFQDLLDANRGGKYFYLSTDEPYYIGLANNAQCQEALHAKKLGSVGRLFAEFAAKAGGYLHDRGRKVFFWGEYPMKPDDLRSLPSFLVNGETYGPAFDPIYKARGIRQMIYTSSEGEEKFFPDYFILPPARRLHPGYSGSPRAQENLEKISNDTARRDSDLLGVVNAGWADMGLHPETFWLGYVISSAAGWHPASPDAHESMSAFYPLFYGPGVVNMSRLYQLMSEQAQFWADSWDTVSSTARKPIWGDSDEIFSPPRPAHDQTLPLPPSPAGDLSYKSGWREENARRLDLAAQALADNDALLGLLGENLMLARWNRYNLEVFRAIARLCRQNLRMLAAIGRIDGLLESAARQRAGNPTQALAPVDQALDMARQIWRERNETYRDAEATWYKSWLPRVSEASGRRFLHELDDVKDHLPDRTVDMSYLVYRETLLPFGEWVSRIASARNAFAEAHRLPVRTYSLSWADLGAAAAPAQ